MREMASKYWAKDDSRVAIDFLLARTYKWDDLYNNSFRQGWVRNFLAYYSPIINAGRWDTSLIFEGEQGELVRMYSPELRVAIQRLKSIITKQRLSFQLMAEVSGVDVSEEIKIGNALADQIVQNQRMDIKFPDCLEGALVTGKWFMKTIWSSELGDPCGYRKEDGRLLHAGGPEISPVSVFDMFYDVDCNNMQERNWMMARVKRNRWDLIAEHPDLANYIRQLPAAQEELGAAFWFDTRNVNYDTVLVYEFYHRPSPAIPHGRMIIFSDSRTVYYDDKNKYGCIPIEEMSPETVLDTGLGYPKMSDMLPTQEMLDNTISAVATNSSQFAVQNILVDRASDINLEQINGMRFIEYTADANGRGEPKALNLSATAPETFKFIDLLGKNLDKMSLLNGALQGNPPPGVTSGTAIATLAASGIESITPYTLCYLQCAERTMWHAFNAFQKFGDAFQTLRVTGQNSQIMGRKFNKEHIKNLSGIKILTTNPLMNTIAGRIEIAEKIFTIPRSEWGDYVSILDGNPLSNLTKNEVSNKDLILMENDKMAMGVDVMVLATDDHAAHIKGHAAPLNDPAVRMNGKENKRFTDHIEEHYRQSQIVPPDLMFMVQTGQMPPPGQGGGHPPQPMPAPAPGPQGPAAPPAIQPVGGLQPGSRPIGLPPELAGTFNGRKLADVATPAKDLLGRR